jgi:glucokinase
MLFYDGSEYHPIGSEGGHCDFAPMNSLQDELLVWMRKRYTEHVSVERLISGVGLYTIYEFLKERGFASECEAMLFLKEEDDKNAMVTQCALEERDPLCLKSMQLFVEIYGAEAGNLALKSLSLGGVYIGGGIAPKILPFLVDGTFLEAFISKGRFKEMLASMQIKVSINQETALLGAAHFANDKMFQV